MSQEVAAVGSPPSTVKAAIILQFALVATLTLIAAVAVAEAIHYDSLIDQAVRATGADPADVALERSSNVAGALFTTIAALLLAGWLGVTAWWMRRGSNVARILALVGLGAPLVLGVLACLTGGLIGVILAGVLLQAPEESGFEEPDPAEWDGAALFDEIDRLSGDGWSIAFDAAGPTAVLLGLLLAGATGVLLLVRSSRHYFQPVSPTAVHPYPGHVPGPAGGYWYPTSTPGDAVPPHPERPGEPERPDEPGTAGTR